jgi:hypothetical protein
VIVTGGSRSNGAFFARHLMRGDHNARVAVMELRGLMARTVAEAFHEMAVIASGTRTTNHLYHASLNPDPGETLTPEQWNQATDILERQLGFTGQPRVVVEHEKEGGRVHRHVVWSRIEADTLTARPDSLTYRKHERASREIERLLGHRAVPSVLVKDRSTPRPPRRPKDWESHRRQESGRDPQSIAAEVTALWHATDSGSSFAAALASRGYVLAKGDRRDFVLVDPAGDDHSLARRISGVTAAGIRLRMAGIDRNALPSVTEARALARQGGGATGDSRAAAAPPSASAAGIEAAPAPRVSTPSDVAIAAAQVRAVAAQYRLTGLRAGRPVRQAMPRSTAPVDTATATGQVIAALLPFLRAILKHGGLPSILVTVIDDGLRWWQRAAQQMAIQDAPDAPTGARRRG